MNRHRTRPLHPLRGRGDHGASLVEYVLLLSLITLVAFAALSAFGQTNGGSINKSASKIVAAEGGSFTP